MAQYGNVQQWLLEERANQGLLKRQRSNLELKEDFTIAIVDLYDSPWTSLTGQEGHGFEEQVVEVTAIRTSPLPQIPQIQTIPR